MRIVITCIIVLFIQATLNAQVDTIDQYIPRLDKSDYPKIPIYEIEAHLRSNSNLKYFPSAPAKIKIQHHECQEMYNCSCHRMLDYGIINVGPMIEDVPEDTYIMNNDGWKNIFLRKLDTINNSDLYGFYTIYSKVYGRLENRMKFVRSIDFTINPNDTLRFVDPDWSWLISNNWSYFLDEKDETIEKFWFECAVRVSSDSIPMGQPVESVTPIALLTNKRLYLFSEILLPRPPENCGWFEQFSGKLFDFEGSNRKDCYSKAVKNYSKKFKETFSRTPFLASETRKQMIPDEITLRREKSKSKVLGSIYWETITYNIRWFNLDSSGSALGGQYGLYSGDYKGNESLFMNIDIALFTSTGPKDDFKDVTMHDELYKTKIDKELSTILRTTCMELGGTISNGICKCNCNN